MVWEGLSTKSTTMRSNCQKQGPQAFVPAAKRKEKVGDKSWGCGGGGEHCAGSVLEQKAGTNTRKAKGLSLGNFVRLWGKGQDILPRHRDCHSSDGHWLGEPKTPVSPDLS